MTIIKLKAQVSEMLLKQNNAGAFSLNLLPDVSVEWRWNSPNHGSLSMEVSSPSLFDANTLIYLAQIALPSVLKYRAVMMVDQRNNIFRLMITDIPVYLVNIMTALELMMTLREVLVSLLIEGPIRPMRNL
jgi:hypothetical protein